MGVEAKNGGDEALHVIPHHNGRHVIDAGDLPEDELHVLVAGQGETEAVELDHGGARVDRAVSLLPLNLPDSARRASN